MSWEKWAWVGWVIIASVITGVLYAIDKRAAMTDSPASSSKPAARISERTLLGWSVVGGWPGAILVGRVIRHKTRKLPYRIKFAICVAIHLLITSVFILKLIEI